MASITVVYISSEKRHLLGAKELHPSPHRMCSLGTCFLLCPLTFKYYLLETIEQNILCLVTQIWLQRLILASHGSDLSMKLRFAIIFAKMKTSINSSWISDLQQRMHITRQFSELKWKVKTNLERSEGGQFDCVQLFLATHFITP